MTFYRAFEDKYRGSRELIKSRLRVYLPCLLPFKEIYDDSNVLDIGCGRGEWLELMSEIGFNAVGVDLDDGMLKACKQLALNAVCKDALLALKELPDESQVVVSGFHIAEHLPFEILMAIVKEAKRVLKPAGLLILETPNAENIRVGTSYFYHDPTHIKPIPMLTLSFLTEYNGFIRNKILRLQEPEQTNDIISLYDVYCGVSQDYAIVAQKEANIEILSRFDEFFNKGFGISIETMCGLYEEQITEKLAHIEKIAKTAEVKAQNAEQAINSIYSSKSWKITAPFRSMVTLVKSVNQNIKNSLKHAIGKYLNKIENYPVLKSFTYKFIKYFPKVESRFKKFYVGYYLIKYPNETQYNQTGSFNFLPLTTHGEQIFNELKNEILSKGSKN